jgi:hypothetical protein
MVKGKVPTHSGEHDVTLWARPVVAMEGPKFVFAHLTHA